MPAFLFLKYISKFLKPHPKLLFLKLLQCYFEIFSSAKYREKQILFGINSITTLFMKILSTVWQGLCKKFMVNNIGNQKLFHNFAMYNTYMFFILKKTTIQLPLCFKWESFVVMKNNAIYRNIFLTEQQASFYVKCDTQGTSNTTTTYYKKRLNFFYNSRCVIAQQHSTGKIGFKCNKFLISTKTSGCYMSLSVMIIDYLTD